MSDRPSDGMDLDELRDEFDWMFEFQSLMAERIRGDADVHNLVDYVGKLEEENAKLCEDNDRLIEAIEELHSVSLEDRLVQLENDNDKLRGLVKDMWHDIPKSESCEFDIHLGHCTPKTPCSGECAYWYRMKELGIEVDG